MMNPIERGISVDFPGRSRLARSETGMPEEFVMTSARYEQIFGRPYVRTFTIPAVVIQDCRPVVGRMIQMISAADWSRTYGAELPIPVIVPNVQFSPTDGWRDGDYYTIRIPVQNSKRVQFTTLFIEDPEIIDADDGYRYFEYRESEAGNDANQPSGLVLRWRREDEEHNIMTRSATHW